MHVGSFKLPQRHHYQPETLNPTLPVHAQGVLPEDYRTQLCASIAAGGGGCPLGAQCQHAHAPAELRADAAVRLKLLPATYKTALCAAFLADGARAPSNGSVLCLQHLVLRTSRATV